MSQHICSLLLQKEPQEFKLFLKGTSGPGAHLVLQARARRYEPLLQRPPPPTAPPLEEACPWQALRFSAGELDYLAGLNDPTVPAVQTVQAVQAVQAASSVSMAPAVPAVPAVRAGPVVPAVPSAVTDQLASTGYFCNDLGASWATIVYHDIMHLGKVPANLTQEPLMANLTWLGEVPIEAGLNFEIKDADKECLTKKAAVLRDFLLENGARVTKWDALKISQLFQQCRERALAADHWAHKAATFLQQICDGYINYPSYLLWNAARGRQLYKFEQDGHAMAKTANNLTVDEKDFAFAVMSDFRTAFEASGLFAAGPAEHVGLSITESNIKMIRNIWPAKQVREPMRPCFCFVVVQFCGSYMFWQDAMDLG